MTQSTATTALEGASPNPGRVGPGRRSSLRRPQQLAAYLFITPFFTVFALMTVLPLVYAAGVSMFRIRIIGGTTFVGLENFGRVLSDPLFYDGLGRVLLYMAFQIPLTIGLALLFALAFDSGRVRASGVSRLLMFIPNAVPIVVATLMWGYMYGDDFGPIAQLANALGLPDPHLLAPDNILGAMVNIAFWSALGYNMIILYASLQSIPHELYEAATIDGAGQLRMAWSIKIPSIAPSLMLCVILSFITGFQLFNEPNLLAPLAPGSISSSYTPNIYIFRQAFSANDVSYAAAMSFVLGIIIIAVSYATQLATRRKRAHR